MKRLLKPIALKERSFNVNRLHKILEIFGLGVTKEETAESKAGEDTLKKFVVSNKGRTTIMRDVPALKMGT